MLEAVLTTGSNVGFPVVELFSLSPRACQMSAEVQMSVWILARNFYAGRCLGRSCDALLTSWNASLGSLSYFVLQRPLTPVLTDDGTSLTVVARYP